MCPNPGGTARPALVRTLQQVFYLWRGMDHGLTYFGTPASVGLMEFQHVYCFSANLRPSDVVIRSNIFRVCDFRQLHRGTTQLFVGAVDIKACFDNFRACNGF